MENDTTQYAGFWIRFVAYLIDAVVISFIEGVLIIPLLILLGFNAAFFQSFTELQEVDPVVLIPAIISAGTGIYLSIFLITWLYYAVMQSGPRQATVGKMALGLIVIDANGDRLSFGRASLRFFSKIISNAILMIGYIMAGFTSRKQALHDMIANTYVIRK